MNDILYNDTKVVLDKETLTVVSNEGKGSINLTTVDYVETIMECICIIFKGKSSLMIPHAAFKNKEDRINFENIIRKYADTEEIS